MLGVGKGNDEESFFASYCVNTLYHWFMWYLKVTSQITYTICVDWGKDISSEKQENTLTTHYF
jgi:hypothetical protein